MTELSLVDFDLEQIAQSGQCFRFLKKEGRKYSLIAGSRYIELEQTGDKVSFGCEPEEFESFWRGFFDLDADYGKYKSAVDTEDTYLQSALKITGGLRILRQELWETIVSFIISQRNNIPRIMKCVENLCLLLGETCYTKEGQEYHAFPGPERLAASEIDELAPAKLGYRAGYIIKTARQVVNGDIELEPMKRMSYMEAKEQLLRLTGVGIKVAECVCLFGLHHIESFPIDTHIRQMLDLNYPDGFPMDRYKGFAGVIQQYAFLYELWKDKPARSG